METSASREDHWSNPARGSAKNLGFHAFAYAEQKEIVTVVPRARKIKAGARVRELVCLRCGKSIILIIPTAFDSTTRKAAQQSSQTQGCILAFWSLNSVRSLHSAQSVRCLVSGEAALKRATAAESPLAVAFCPRRGGKDLLVHGKKVLGPITRLHHDSRLFLGQPARRREGMMIYC